jgi:hypothetical protein
MVEQFVSILVFLLNLCDFKKQESGCLHCTKAKYDDVSGAGDRHKMG